MIALSSPGPASHHIPTSIGSYKLLTSFTLPPSEGGVTVAKWQSEESGLSVVWADVEGPLVNGYWSTRTEVFDDKGIPHTLEHLVFLGSEKYAYKGVLDTISNRLFANGTNAWTSTTDTTYTVGTAGPEGFLGILPVYLDHVLYPTLTKEGFVTEVYAINGKGEDSGVVFSEMQGRENGSGDLMALRLQRTLYSKLNGLRSETGGLMSALRELSVEEIRDYHSKTYLPQNITLIVTGRSLSPTALLSTLVNEVEPSIKEHGQSKGPRPESWKRPWVETSSAKNPPTIPKDLIEIVEFPEEDESVGEISINWIGVKNGDHLTRTALECLGEYLTDGPVAPLMKKFVEVEDPWATDISLNISSESPCILSCDLSSVPTEHLSSLASQLRSYLSSIVSTEGIEMIRMKAIIERMRLSALDQYETDGGEGVAMSVVEDTLWGEISGEGMREAMGLGDYETLGEWGEKEWLGLLEKYYVTPSAITLLGTPSSSLSSSLEAATKALVAKRVSELGPSGLAEKAKIIELSQKENDKPIPGEILRRFEVPDVRGIDWIKVGSARAEGVGGKEVEVEGVNKLVKEKVKGDGTELGVVVQFDHINSSFLELTILLFPSPSLPTSLLSLLPIYLDSFFSLPLTLSDGTELTFEQVVKKLDEEVLSYEIDVGGLAQEGVALKLKVSKERYEVAVAWAKDLLEGSKWDLERLKISALKAVQNLPSEKRNGSGVAHATYRSLVKGEDSTNLSMNLLNRVDSVPAFLERLKDDPEGLVKDFEKLRRGLIDPKSMRISVKGDILGLEDPVKTWKEKFRDWPVFEKKELVPVLLGSDALSPLGKAPLKKLVIYGISSIESSFAYHVAKGPVGWSHPDQPALTVARSILNAMEGFLWKFIRGAGLAYGANIDQDHESGFIYYRVFKSPDTFAAFEAAKDLIDSLVEGKIKIDDLTIESAKSSLAYNTASKESTMSDAATASFINQIIRGLPQDQGRAALEATRNITIPQVLDAIKKYIQPIFNPSTSVAAVASGLVKVDSTVERFEKEGFEVEKRTFGKDDDEEEEDDDEEGSEDGSAMSL